MGGEAMGTHLVSWAPRLQSQITMSSPIVGQVLFFRERFSIYAVSLIFNVLTFFF